MARSEHTPTGGGLPGAVAAEWTKLWSLRSTWVYVLAAAGLMALTASSTAEMMAATSAGGDTPEVGRIALGGIAGAQFPVLAWAVLVITTEYATRSITVTLMAVPRRLRLVGAKAVVICAATFVVGSLLGVFGVAVAAGVLGQATDPEWASVVSDVLTVGFYTATVSAFTLGLALVLKNAVGTLFTVIVLLIGLPNLLAGASITWVSRTADLLPGGAASHLLGDASGAYSAPFAAVLLVAWACASLLLGAVALSVRDA